MTEWIKPESDVHAHLYLAGLQFPHVCYFLYPSLYSQDNHQQDSNERGYGSWFRRTTKRFCLLRRPALRASFPKWPPWLPRSCQTTCIHSHSNFLAHNAAWGLRIKANSSGTTKELRRKGVTRSWRDRRDYTSYFKADDNLNKGADLVKFCFP